MDINEELLNSMNERIEELGGWLNSIMNNVCACYDYGKLDPTEHLEKCPYYKLVQK